MKSENCVKYISIMQSLHLGASPCSHYFFCTTCVKACKKICLKKFTNLFLIEMFFANEKNKACLQICQVRVCNFIKTRGHGLFFGVFLAKKREKFYPSFLHILRNYSAWNESCETNCFCGLSLGTLSSSRERKTTQRLEELLKSHMGEIMVYDKFCFKLGKVSNELWFHERRPRKMTNGFAAKTCQSWDVPSRESITLSHTCGT